MRSYNEYRDTMKKKIRWILEERGMLTSGPSEEVLHEIMVSCMRDMSPGEIFDLFYTRNFNGLASTLKRNLILFTLPNRRQAAAYDFISAMFNAAAENILLFVEEVVDEEKKHETNQPGVEV